GSFDVAVGNALGCDTPVVSLATSQALGAHDEVLGAGNADHLLQASGAARARDLPKPLLRQRVLACLGRDAEIASQRNLKAHSKAVAAVGGDHRLATARRGGNVPGEPRHMLRACLQKSPNISAAGKMLTDGSQHDNPNTCILIQRLEGEAQLIALRHLDDVERRPVENDVGPLLGGINLDVKTVEFAKTRIKERRRCAHLGPIFIGCGSVRSISYSPTTSLRRSSL